MILRRLDIRTAFVVLTAWSCLVSSYVIPERDALVNLQPQQKPISTGQDLLFNSPKDSEFESWAKEELTNAFDLLLGNVGSRVGAVPGAVIASPSKAHPNYFYQWVRDAAITMGTVVREYERTGNETLLAIIYEYIVMQSKLQHTDNPSGGYRTGGLGEPKFEADGKAFWGPWGRRQNDGPALRATTIIDYLRVLNKTEPSLLTAPKDWVNFLYDAALPTFSVIKADLEYVSHVWTNSGFDLWEEVDGYHFFTAMTQLRAMTDGRDIANFFNDSGAAEWYEDHRRNLQIFVHQFWDSSKGHLVSTLESHRSGLDCAIQLAALYGGSEDTAYPAWSDEILISTHRLLQDMRRRHSINRESYQGNVLAGWGVGRYPEDIYNGDGTSRGNPWFLCTSSVSEVLYRTISRYLEKGEIEINSMNLPFFMNVYPQAVQKRIGATEEEFGRILQLLFQWADGFLKVVKKHAKDHRHLSEQFDTDQPGYQKGARDLTWSYGSVIEALRQREDTRRQLEKYKL